MSGTDKPDYVRRREESEKQTEERKRSDGDAQQRKQDRSTLASLIKDIRSRRQAQHEVEQKRLPFDKVAALAAVIAAVLSLGSLIAFVVLTLKTDRTARRALDISAQQLLDTENTQRAFVIQPAFSGPDVFTLEDGKTMSRYTFHWENSGATAAFHLSVNTECVRIPFEFTNGRETILWHIKKGGDPSYLAAKETAAIGNCSIRNDLMADLIAHRKFFYFAARADYVDVFGRPHILRECTELVFQPNGLREFADCPGFPCADKDCQ